MHGIYELKEMLCKELEEYGEKKDLTAGSLEVVDKLAHTVKNLGKIIESYEEEDGEYSGAMYDDGMGGMSYERGGTRGGSYRGTYRGSYARNGRGRGSDANRDRRGRYSSEGYSREGGGSYADDVESVKAEIRELAMELPEQHRRKIERAVDGMM